MPKYLVANWKCNKTSSEVQTWAETFKDSTTIQGDKVKVVICPSFVHLHLLHSLLENKVSLGTQTLSPYPNGTYTGAISALIASEFAQYAILGHVERRKYFAETNQMVANAAIQALDNNIIPIIAVDKSNWSSQLAMLDDGYLKKSLIMYEPPEAISGNDGSHAAELDDVRNTIQLIKGEYPVMGCLYGGSLNSSNAELYAGATGLDGAVVGASSLDVNEFVRILQKVSLL